MNEHEWSETEWRESCFLAFDLMRDAPEQGRAIAAAMRRQALARRLPVLGTFAELLFAFADFFEGKLALAEPEFERTAAMFELVGDEEGIAFANLGTVAVWRKHGMSEQAYSLCHSKILPLLSSRDNRLSVMIFNILGTLSQELGFTEEAVRHFYTSLEQARRLNIPNRVSQVLANLGEIFYLSGNAPYAEELLEEARRLAVNSNERWLAPFISTMLALCKLALEKYEEAYLSVLTYVDEDSAAHHTDSASRAFCFSVAAYTLAMQGQLSKADQLNAVAMDLLETFEDRPLKPYSWWVSGHLHQCHQRYPEAIRDLQRAIEENANKGYCYTSLCAMKALGDLHASLGQFEEAYQQQQCYLELYTKMQGRATRLHVETVEFKNALKQTELALRLTESALQERQLLQHQLASR